LAKLFMAFIDQAVQEADSGRVQNRGLKKLALAGEPAAGVF
jgi:hypothetical protein